MAFKLILYFANPKKPELVQTCFQLNASSASLKCVRGRTAGAHKGCGTFLWSNAVQAMAILFVRAKLGEEGGVLYQDGPLLQGSTRSPASSLDMSISARTAWLFEMFGSDAGGGSLARRIFSRSNSGMKLPGAVSVGLNHRLIRPDEVTIKIDGIPAVQQQLWAIDTELTAGFEGADNFTVISDEGMMAIDQRVLPDSHPTHRCTI